MTIDAQGVHSFNASLLLWQLDDLQRRLLRDRGCKAESEKPKIVGSSLGHDAALCIWRVHVRLVLRISFSMLLMMGNNRGGCCDGLRLAGST